MIKLIFVAIAILFSFQIICSKGYKKLFWFIGGLLFFPNSIILFEGGIIVNFPRLLTYVIVIQAILSPNFLKVLKDFPVRIGMNAVFVSLIIICLFDDRLKPILKLYRPLTVFCENFLPIFVSFYYINSIADVFKIFKFLLAAFLLFGLFGIVNYFEHSNYYYSLITDTYGTYDFANVNMQLFVERFRISSFAWHAIYYGLLLDFAILLIVFLLTFHLTKPIYRSGCYILLLLLLVNLFLVNSRTPLYTLALGFLIFYGWGLDLTSKINAFLTIALIAVFALMFIPKAKQLLLASIETVSSKGSELEEGSSVDMRIGQLNASLSLFGRSPITGNGIYYINETLGYDPNYLTSQSDEELHGFESYSYELLIEQGLAGIIANIILIGQLIYFFVKNLKSKLKVQKSFSLFSLCALVTFLSFILGTGVMGSLPIFMILMGINIKAIELANSPEHFCV